MEKQLNQTEKPVVRLSRDEYGNLTFEPFVSNGTKYRMIKPGTAIGIHKFTQYKKLSVVVGAGATFSAIIEENKAVIELLSSDKPLAQVRREALLRLDSMNKGILDLSKSRYHKAFYLASIFIYPDGTDPREWSMELAEKMIEDWAIDVDENDLLFFSLFLIPAFSDLIAGLKEEAEAKASGIWSVFMQSMEQIES
jgi:hypothetical protein